MKEYSTKNFADVVPCSPDTLTKWRQFEEGISKPLFAPDHYNERGHAVYTEAQLPIARALLAQRKSTLRNKTEQATPMDAPTADIVLHEDKKNMLATPDAASQITDQNNHGNNNKTADDKQIRINAAKNNAAKNNAAKNNAAKKNFLPMTITPNFDAIPQMMKDLPRWLLWRLIPADPKPKKVPMTPKYGKLVNADVTNPDNWLSFNDAINSSNQQLCSGIGFVLCDTEPKICCVDVDHCVNPDGSLNDEAKAVIAICADSFVELSQSGKGIHVWFEDNGFPGERGRKRGNVEVYAFKRYIAMTGNHVEGTADDIKQVNGACKAVIDKFIERHERHSDGNLFKVKPARTTTEKKIIAAPVDVTLTDSDVKLIDYFRSDKCHARDSNLFDLFNGNVDEYFKNTGKEFDDSVADCDLLLKILWYIGGDGGSDDDIGRHALNLFNASTLAKRDKWLSREDYRLRTLNAALDVWNQNGRHARDDNGDSAQIKDLRAKLKAAIKDLADFDAKKSAALDTLRKLEKFDYETVFDENIITCAAFARCFEPSSYTEIRHAIKNYRKEHADTGVDLNDYGAVTKERAEEIQTEYDSLLANRNKIQAQIRTQNFFSANQDALAGYAIPEGYSVSENGIEKIKAKGNELVCRRPVIISGRVFDTDKKIFLIETSYKNAEGKWRKIKPQERATIFNARKLVELSNLGLPATSQNAGALVTYLDCFFAENEIRLPMCFEVARCGWYEFGEQEHFIDPRRPCVFSDDDGKNINVEVSSQSQFATCLTTRGSLSEWKRAYESAKPYPVARFAVATAVAPILLKVLGERNFLTYIFGKTRGGKTTAATLAASTFGSEKVIRSFDATKNGLAGAAADVSDYCFIVDEKQVADNKLKETFDNVIYAIANGVGRLRLDKDGSVRKVQDWRTIALMTGETRMIEDNTIGGADTRLLSINAGDEVMPPDVCKQIRSIVKNNCGHVLPLVADKVQSTKSELWQEDYDDIQRVFAEDYPDHLDEHRRYIASITLADAILNDVLYGNSEEALLDAIANAKEIFKLIPMTAEFDTTQREVDFVRDFISRNQNQFISNDREAKDIRGGVFGSLKDPVFFYIAVGVLKDACKSAGFDYGKLVDDLIAAGFFVPDNKTEKDRKNRRDTVLQRLGKTPTRCFRINRDKFNK